MTSSCPFGTLTLNQIAYDQIIQNDYPSGESSTSVTYTKSTHFLFFFSCKPLIHLKVFIIASILVRAFLTLVVDT